MAFLAGPPDPSRRSGRLRDSDASRHEAGESRTVRIVGGGSVRLRSGTTAIERIVAIASVQRGLVSRGQLLAAGIDRHTVDRLIARGWLLRVHRGVFAVGHRSRTPLGPETAALLATRDGASLSHHTAAALWGMRAPGGRSASAGPRADASADASASMIHLTVPGSPAGHPVGVVVHRSHILEARDRRVHHGLPVTSPPRTLLDLAASLPGRVLERAFDQALVMGVMTLRDVAELLRRCGRHRGRRRLQAVLDGHTSTTFTRSRAEERFLALVRQAGLPQPLTNVRRHGYEIDFLWPDRAIAVEVDGYAFHRTRRAFEADRRRDAELRAAGIDTIRVTWPQLTDEPLAVIARLAQALATASR